MLATVGRTPGRTLWSARVPLDPLLVQPHQPHAIHKRPTGGPAADQGVRPTPTNRMAAR
jgi:hypothetical protein